MAALPMAHVLAHTSEGVTAFDRTGQTITATADPSVITIKLEIMNVTAEGTVNLSGYSMFETPSTTTITTTTTTTVVSTVSVTVAATTGEDLTAASATNVAAGTMLGGHHTADWPPSVVQGEGVSSQITTDGSQWLPTVTSFTSATAGAGTTTPPTITHLSNSGPADVINFSTPPIWSVPATVAVQSTQLCWASASTKARNGAESTGDWKARFASGTVWQDCQGSNITSTDKWRWPTRTPVPSTSLTPKLSSLTAEPFQSSARSPYHRRAWVIVASLSLAWSIWGLTLVSPIAMG